MTLDNTKNQVKVFYKKISKDLTKGVSEDKCNTYISYIEEIKEHLYDEDMDWVEDFSGIEQFGQGLFSEPASKSDIKKTMAKIHEQLDGICLKLGIEIEEPQNNNVMPQQVFNISQIQNQTTDVNINIQMENMIKEFEEEISKPNSDKSKLKTIMSNVLKYGATYAPKLIELLIKYW